MDQVDAAIRSAHLGQMRALDEDRSRGMFDRF